MEATWPEPDFIHLVRLVSGVHFRFPYLAILLVTTKLLVVAILLAVTARE